MKKSIKKLQLKKRSISELNAHIVKGGIIPTTSLISVFCRTAFPMGEDICFTDHPQR